MADCIDLLWETAAEHEIEISMRDEEAEKAFTILGFGYTIK